MSEQPDFRELQFDFAAHIRDPKANPAPANIEDRRLAIYRDLFFNNVAGLLAGTFPVIHQILSAEHWQSLMRDYFSRHRSHTPLFLEMPQEFITFLQEERGDHDDDPPFLIELAHYEWTELAIAIIEDEPDLAGIDRAADLLDGVPIVSPTAWSVAYAYPVHKIRADFQPEEPGEDPTFLVVYRDLEDDVGFLEINAVTARLLELLEREEGLSGRAILEQVAGEIDHPDPRAVVNGGRDILEQLCRKDVILGVRNATGQQSGDDAD